MDGEQSKNSEDETLTPLGGQILIDNQESTIRQGYTSITHESLVAAMKMRLE